MVSCILYTFHKNYPFNLLNNFQIYFFVHIIKDNNRNLKTRHDKQKEWNQTYPKICKIFINISMIAPNLVGASNICSCILSLLICSYPSLLLVNIGNIGAYFKIVKNS
ncbi:hypothetical protein C2G38_1616000 [Gigaspora rosea]|uniref:Uncharacterized protein n=1 Tax=Gigaspora rosea TaxID=44941 RepID=A0A397V4M7_9GLOM|nr:hypothetical protein C2G38_1616000 [Gigaspora rosea]